MVVVSCWMYFVNLLHEVCIFIKLFAFIFLFLNIEKIYFSIKYSGFYSCLLGLFIIGCEFWNLLGNRTLLLKTLLNYFIKISCLLIIIPAIIYISIFAIHLNLLTKAGPHDTVMTSAFQASLEGGLASITKGQPLHVAHGSQITLR